MGASFLTVGERFYKRGRGECRTKPCVVLELEVLLSVDGF